MTAPKLFIAVPPPSAGSQIIEAANSGVIWAKNASIAILAILMATAVIAFLLHRD